MVDSIVDVRSNKESLSTEIVPYCEPSGGDQRVGRRVSNASLLNVDIGVFDPERLFHRLYDRFYPVPTTLKRQTSDV